MYHSEAQYKKSLELIAKRQRYSIFQLAYFIRFGAVWCQKWRDVNTRALCCYDPGDFSCIGLDGINKEPVSCLELIYFTANNVTLFHGCLEVMKLLHHQGLADPM